MSFEGTKFPLFNSNHPKMKTFSLTILLCICSIEASFLSDINEELNPIDMAGTNDFPSFLSPFNTDFGLGPSKYPRDHLEMVKFWKRSPLTSIIARRFFKEFADGNLPEKINSKLHTKMRIAKTFKRFVTTQRREIDI